MERLSTLTDPINPLFGDFSRALVQRYGADPDSSQKDMQAFWGTDPRQTAAACTTAVLRLKLPDEAGTAQIAYTVEAAAKRGLVVYDDELGMLFLPDGTIFPEDLREGWKFDLEELLAGPEDPNNRQPDNRTLLQTIAMELFESIGRGGKKIY
jgi:hypothetical protein